MGQLFADGNDNEVWRVNNNQSASGAEFDDAVMLFDLYSDSGRTTPVTSATSLTMTWTEADRLRGYRAVLPGTIGLTTGTYYGKVRCTGAYADKIYHEPEFVCVKRR